MICPSCGDSVPDGSRFCPKCGVDLFLFKNGFFCVRCGARLSSSKSFCPKCGAPSAMASSSASSSAARASAYSAASSVSGAGASAFTAASEDSVTAAVSASTESESSSSAGFFADTQYGSVRVNASVSSSGAAPKGFQNSGSRKTQIFYHSRLPSGDGSPLPEDFQEKLMNQIRNARQNISANGSNRGNGSFVFESRGNGQHTFRSGANNGNNLPEGFWENFNNIFKTAFPRNSNGSGSSSSGNDNSSGGSADARSFSDGNNSANNSSGSFDSGEFRGNGQHNFRFSSDNGNNLPESFWENFDNMFKTLFPQNSSSSGNGNSGGNAGASADAAPDDSFAYAPHNGGKQNNQNEQEQHDFQDSFNDNYEFPEDLREDFSGPSGEYAGPDESVKDRSNGRDNARDGSAAGFADSFASASPAGKERNKRDEQQEQDDSQDSFNDVNDYSEEIWQDFLRKSREYTRTNGNTIDPDYAGNGATYAGSHGQDRRQDKGHAAYRHKEETTCRFTHWEKEEFRRLNLSLDAAQRIMMLHIIFIPAGLYLSALSLGYLAFTAPAKIRQAEYFLEKCGCPESVRLCRRELKTMIFFKIMAVLVTLGFIIVAAVSAGAAAGMLDYSQTAVWQLFLIPAVIWAVSLPFQIISFMTFRGIRKDLKNLAPLK